MSDRLQSDDAAKLLGVSRKPYARRGSLLDFVVWAAAYQGDGCLEWPFASKIAGYGVLRIKGRKILAHRYICELAHGDAPTPFLHAAHNCGRGGFGCVNPQHLEWKTVRENALDRLVHGTQTRGEGQHKSKLTEENVREIRRLLGTMLHREIAELFGVGRPSISDIARGITWAWLS